MKSFKLKKLTALVLAMLMCLSLAACSGGDTQTSDNTDSDDPFANGPTVKLTAGDSNVEDHPYHKSLVAMNDYLVEHTGGKISLDIYSAGALGNERELVEQCSLGSVDLIVVSNAPFTNFEKSFTLWDLPYLCSTRDEYFAVLDSDFGQEMLDRLEASGMKGLCYWDASYANLYADKAVHSPADMKGMDVRVLESEAYLYAMEALGANPVTIAWNETYTALQNHTVNGALTTPASGFGANLIDVAPQYTQIETLYMALPFVISLNTWNSLSPAYQDMIMEAALYTRDWNRNYTAQLETEIGQKMEAAGGTVTVLTDAEKQAFIDLVRPYVMERMVGDGKTVSADDLNKVETVLEQYRAAN